MDPAQGSRLGCLPAQEQTVKLPPEQMPTSDLAPTSPMQVSFTAGQCRGSGTGDDG